MSRNLRRELTAAADADLAPLSGRELVKMAAALPERRRVALLDALRPEAEKRLWYALSMSEKPPRQAA